MVIKENNNKISESDIDKLINYIDGGLEVGQSDEITDQKLNESGHNNSQILANKKSKTELISLDDDYQIENNEIHDNMELDNEQESLECYDMLSQENDILKLIENIDLNNKENKNHFIETDIIINENKINRPLFERIKDSNQDLSCLALELYAKFKSKKAHKRKTDKDEEELKEREHSVDKNEKVKKKINFK